MRIEITDARRKDLITEIQAHHRERYDEEIGELRAGLLLEFFIEQLGPPVYNQGVKDATGFVQEKLLDLEGEIYEPDPER